MAKIKVTKVNFTPKVKNSLNDSLVMSMFGDEVKKIVDNLPYEQEIWIDTNEICCIDTMIVENAFIVHFKGKTDKDYVRIKAECFDELLKAWKGEQSMNVDEMARGYMYIHTLEDICANPFTRMKDAYKAGAMAILREMEHYANMEDGCYALECIQMRINELKEE